MPVQLRASVQRLIEPHNLHTLYIQAYIPIHTLDKTLSFAILINIVLLRLTRQLKRRVASGFELLIPPSEATGTSA